jgi:hypothetical protein
MTCNNVNSKELVRAVCEQANAIEEIGGFASDEDCAQFLRDAHDIARKLYIAEQIITVNHLLAVYKVALKTGDVFDVEDK